MLRAINEQKNKDGFTLVELLIVVAIIGILAAIAIPQFAAYRARAYCASSESDLANLAIAEEAYFADNDVYTTDTTAAAIANSWSATTNDVVTVTGGDTAGFTATAAHPNCVDAAGANVTYTWDSTAGGLQ